MKTKNIVIYILIALITILSYKYYQLLQTNKNLLESKNFNFELNQAEDILYSFWKNNNKLSNQYVDKNFDYNYELVYSYDIYGNQLTKSIDDNENGVYEKCITYNAYGKIIGKSFDKNEDGVTETCILILENNNELILTDTNNNGDFEKITFINKQNNTTVEKPITKLFELNLQALL
ncbi:hypothetical protein [Polaribacter sp.]|uniref:hypothetical protein n=1 Tax=Polaribacter sp. TaxID=1920175 RepID=UPI003F6B400D